MFLFAFIHSLKYPDRRNANIIYMVSNIKDIKILMWSEDKLPNYPVSGFTIKKSFSKIG